MKKGLIVADGTSLGTGTTKTQLHGGNNLTMPAWTQCIESITPWLLQGTTIAATQYLAAKFTVESDDVACTPYNIVPYHQQSSLQGVATQVAGKHPPLETFDCNIPLHGGEDMKLYGTMLLANTAASYGGATLAITDAKLDRQLFAEVGTATSTGTTAATEVAGTAYTINGAENIVEVYGHVGATTVVAAKPVTGYIRLESSDFKAAVPCKFEFQAQGSGLSTTITSYSPGVIRYKVDIPTQKSCTIKDYFYGNTISTTAGSWISGVLFHKLDFP